jgi:GT2 family glycosyltransferase
MTNEYPSTHKINPLLIMPVFGEHARECIASVKEHTIDPRFAFVVGLECEYDVDELIKLGRVFYTMGPFNFAGRINRVLREVNTEYYIIMNDDVIVGEGWIGSMYDALREWGPGIVTARVQRGGCHNRDCWKVGLLDAGPPVLTTRQAINMYCCLVPRTVIKKVGMLDERFTGYGGEDEDYSLRVWKAGLKTIVADALVRHIRSASFGEDLRDAIGASQKIFKEKWGVKYPLYPDGWDNERYRRLLCCG